MVWEEVWGIIAGSKKRGQSEQVSQTKKKSKRTGIQPVGQHRSCGVQVRSDG